MARPLILLALLLGAGRAFALEAEIAPSADATTTVGGYTFDLNGFLGANRYYTNSTPINGQNTVTVNLEAGHIWSGNEALTHVTTFYNSADTYGGGAVAPLFDRHATWVGMLIGGRGNSQYETGLAPGTDLRSAAISTGWVSPAYALSFNLSVDSYLTGYSAAFANGDVVNSSFGYTDASGTAALTVVSDAYAFQNPSTLHVVSAGNSGPGTNTVGAPGSSYNTLTVGALTGANSFTTVASFSSRAPQDFGYINTNGLVVTVRGVRAAVDISAPGDSLVSAFYGGQTGGNNPTLTGSTNLGTASNSYSLGIAGTSFASPIVAGGASLVSSAAHTLPSLATNAEASQSMVIKALLLTGADKTSGWNNGQVTNVGVVTTTQSLDWAAGAGRMNLSRTFDLQVNGQAGVSGASAGSQGSIKSSGWDFGASLIGVNNDYTFADVLLGGSAFTTSLSWMRNRYFDEATTDYADVAQANLNISLWALGSDGAFQTKVGESLSLYNTVEHLSFNLPQTGVYGLRVSYGGNTFDNTAGHIWGTAGYAQDYGVAWGGTGVTTLYWSTATNSGQWNGASTNWNTQSSGAGSGSSATTTTTLAVFGGATSASQSVLVNGARGASGISVEGGSVTFSGTNAATLTLGDKGVAVLAAANGPLTFESSLGVTLGAAQTWSNASSRTLEVRGAVGGAGALALRSSSSGAINLTGSVDFAGSISNLGGGTATNTISGRIGPKVTGLTQDSASSALVIAGALPHQYAGATLVQEGVLVVDGNIASSSLTTVADGGTLSGTGTVGNALIASGGTGSPGHSPGTMTVSGNFSWLGGGNYNWQVYDTSGIAGSTGGWDLYSISGQLDLSSLSINSKFNINLWTLSGVAPDVSGSALGFDFSHGYRWAIATAQGGILGFSASYFNVSTSARNGAAGFANPVYGGTFSVGTTGNNLELVYSAPVPEPGTWACGAALVSAMAVSLYRRGSRVSRSLSPR